MSTPTREEAISSMKNVKQWCSDKDCTECPIANCDKLCDVIPFEWEILE